MPGAIAMEIGGGVNSWAARNRQLKTEMADDDSEITRKLKSLLNKLSGDNFDRIFLQMTEVGISNDSQVRILMKEVFEKAVNQHFYIEVYTRLTLKLNDFIKNESQLNDKIDFRKILINECQELFSVGEDLNLDVGKADVNNQDEFVMNH